MDSTTACATTAAATPFVSFGLEGVVVADTRLSDVDGQQGRLTIAGYSLEQLIESHSFDTVVGLLLRGRPPAPSEAERLRAALGAARLRAHTWLAKRRWLLSSPECMLTLRAAFGSFEFQVPTTPGTPRNEAWATPELHATLELVALASVATGHWVREQQGRALLEPDPTAAHASDLLRLMHGRAASAAEARALDVYLMSVVDHGLNASTFAARVVASTGSDLVSAVTAAVGALKGPLHGGAPGPVLDMLDAIGTASAARPWLERELSQGRRIMGMGHRVYRVRDPRAFVLERAFQTLAEGAPALQPRFDLARAVETEAEALLAARSKGRAIRANVEFFTALLLDALGIPREAFTGVFSAGRMAGWCAHFYEQASSGRLLRPSSRYVGPPAPAR